LAQNKGLLQSTKATFDVIAVDVQEAHEEIIFTFRQKAEQKGLWFSIGIDQWIATRSWWLYRARWGFNQSEQRITAVEHQA
jgi:hypothetical protein